MTQEDLKARRDALEQMRKFIVSEKPWTYIPGNKDINYKKVWNSWETLQSDAKFKDKSVFSERFEKLAAIIKMDTINNVGRGFRDLM